MNYVRPFGQFIEFDNSDIIVTSKLNPRWCNWRQAGIVCSPNADDELANECGYSGIADNTDYTDYQLWCYLVTWDAPPIETCTAAAANHDFENSILPPPGK